MIPKYAFIIDSYPQDEVQKERLIENLSILKKENIDVLLTSHYPCSSEIIENTTYFLFEKKNNYYFLDSDILNENITQVKNPVYLKYITIGEEIFYDRLVITGWSVAITSQLFNSIKFLYSKGYEYAFYLVDDFICPSDIKTKIENILEKSKDKRNYFIKNQANFSSWFAGFFFGFKIDDNLISRLPNIDFSENKTYQRYFPNFACEDVINYIWLNDDNYIDPHEELDNIFGPKNWNLVSSIIKSGQSQLQNSTSSSIYVNLKNDNKFCLMIYSYWDSPYDKVQFNFEISNDKGDVLYNKSFDLLRGYWYKEYLDYIFENNDLIIFKKRIVGLSGENETCVLDDNIIINKEEIVSYELLKKFEKI